VPTSRHGTARVLKGRAWAIGGPCGWARHRPMSLPCRAGLSSSGLCPHRARAVPCWRPVWRVPSFLCGPRRSSTCSRVAARASRREVSSPLSQVGMKTDRIWTDIADIIFVFIFLSDSNSNTESINHAGYDMIGYRRHKYAV
jgi:hypothetical protein